jgi:anthranilate/para-aminobenzoate synthase component II
MIRDALVKLADRTNLSTSEAEEVMSEIMDGSATPAQIAAYLMGLRHRTLCVEGVQFHPESILTTVGKDLLRNFLKL